MDANALILINSNACGGSSIEQWKLIGPEIMKRLDGSIVVDQYLSMEKLDKMIDDHSIDKVIGAGGDGTINFLVNYLIRSQRNNEIALGGIGLGSSNDFHKPFGTRINGLPVRIGKTAKVDVGKVEFSDTSGIRRSRYFLLNASLGVLADANNFFNSEVGILRLLKKRSFRLSMLYAAIVTILKNKKYRISLESISHRYSGMIRNLSVIKSPHISGKLHYDQDISRSDGLLGINYCTGQSIMSVFKVMKDLEAGHFTGKSDRVSFKDSSLIVFSDQFLALETDGEVAMGKDFKFSIIPKAIHMMGNN